MGNAILTKQQSHKGQSTLELAIAMILTIMIVGAITNIWLWGNHHLVDRQRWYQNTRWLAGQSHDAYIPAMTIWKDGPMPFYQLHSLTENDVFVKRR
ncbi:MAG: hypothetical protein KBA46_01225 [Candidatus Omnitrophica bacterium]|nr:hypothetical protein [Candidatus Omnitrophota bacterium]